MIWSLGLDDGVGQKGLRSADQHKPGLLVQQKGGQKSYSELLVGQLQGAWAGY